MALTRLNYAPGQYETCTDETLTPASPVLNTWYNFEIGQWKYALADVVLKQSGVAIPTSAYELAIDTKYTTREAGESGKTIYAKWRIVDTDYDAIATTVSGNNFGSYIDNEKLDSRLDALEAFDAALDAGEVPYDNSTSGLTADDVQAAIDEIAAIKTAVFSGARSGYPQYIDIAIPFANIVDVVVVAVIADGTRYTISANGADDGGVPTVNFSIANNSGNTRVTVYWETIELIGIIITNYTIVVRHT